MCGRYVSPDEAAIEREWHIGRQNSTSGLKEIFAANYNVAPTSRAPVVRVVRDQAGENQADLLTY